MTSSQTRSFTEKVGLLSEVALFAGLSEADMQAIGHATTMTHCVRGQQILSPDDPPDRIHIIKKGRIRVYRMSPDGKQLTLDIYEKGTILGDMSVLGQDRLPEAYAEAIDEGVICTIAPDELNRLIERYPVVGVNIIRHLSRRLQAAERELEAMAYQRVDQRLAHKRGRRRSRRIRCPKIRGVRCPNHVRRLLRRTAGRRATTTCRPRVCADHNILWFGEEWLARKDSILRSPDPESGALPLGHSPVNAGAVYQSARRPRTTPPPRTRPAPIRPQL